MEKIILIPKGKGLVPDALKGLVPDALQELLAWKEEKKINQKEHIHLS